MNIKKRILAIVTIVFFLPMPITSQSAGCRFNGQLYPTGSVVNGYTCQADGTWK